MKFYDLFCGIGGFRLGFERNGHRCVGSCEIDKYAREIYQKRFGNEPDLDARQLDSSSLPEFDILTAGFPCQAFSIAGKRLGFSDTRGSLFFEIARIAREKRPQLLFLENVKGLLNHDRGRTFGTIVNTLYELGYDVEWQVINGKYFVPQNRERIFIIGHLRAKPIRKIFPLTENNQINDRTCTEAQEQREWIRSPHTRAIDSNYTKGGGSRTMIKVLNSDTQCFRIYDQSSISPTLGTCNTGGRHVPSIMTDRVRKLTPLECERLMGFPEGWTEGVSDTQRYTLLGNSVIVPVIEYISALF